MRIYCRGTAQAQPLPSSVTATATPRVVLSQRGRLRGPQTSLCHAPRPCSEQQPEGVEMPAEPCVAVLAPLRSLSRPGARAPSFPPTHLRPSSRSLGAPRHPSLSRLHHWSSPFPPRASALASALLGACGPRLTFFFQRRGVDCLSGRGRQCRLQERAGSLLGLQGAVSGVGVNPRALTLQRRGLAHAASVSAPAQQRTWHYLWYRRVARISSQSPRRALRRLAQHRGPGCAGSQRLRTAFKTCLLTARKRHQEMTFLK